jgi:SAM-dependent methyltransferase
MAAIDEAKLHEFVGRMLGDLGGATSVALVRIGDALGLYRALRDGGPATSAEFAARTGLAERYLREWLSQQAASGYLTYDPASCRFALPPEQAAVLADEDSPVYMAPAFDVAAALLDNQPQVQEAFRTGAGVAWGDQATCLFCATARFFRPGYVANLVQSWLPALDGVVAKLERGARVADVGCGHGVSTALMAQAFPNSEFVGFDFHPASVEAAREHARGHGVDGNARFEVGTAKDYPGEGLDLVTFFDCLHDMGDPVGAARHVRETLAPDGTWMVVEPMAQDRLEDNLNPVGRLYYAGSTMICVPTSLAQEVGAALGAQAGEARLREAVVTGGGFSRFRRAAETPFNMVLEARP